ncbi:hypothetical protein GCM10007047_01150 [Cerasicoccus arenae]|uniref:Uncharacterized protein n=1 Tax=Cerasicoccus arenae TaxID=424488 RepID=A0A8J3DEH2_9BACT|nr:hypothetical protein GCM10007047_01150 [Cerasicoccus arenae]
MDDKLVFVGVFALIVVVFENGNAVAIMSEIAAQFRCTRVQLAEFGHLAEWENAGLVAGHMDEFADCLTMKFPAKLLQRVGLFCM